MSALDDVRKYCDAWSIAYAGGDLDHIAGSYTNDTVYLTPRLPTVRGGSEIAKLFAERSSEGVRFEPGEVFYEGGDLIVDVGQFVMTDSDGTEQRRGRYVAVYKRQPDGELKIVVDVPLPE